ncbi:probable membrane-associated kinase regulator 6 [Impatiens glandulifera]|uniref:probable membrane-associated kinase regulator 6 n=1 Tax=Impatiens glandulifera TaxID=253017 RepID=UPI001FB19F61|nr:probable membrane-associated kinase regulator 6 [Impatiens glandulifera]
MEASQLLSIESFSSSWLANQASFFDGFGSSRTSIDNSDQIQVFGRLLSQKSLEEARNFNFDIPSPKSSLVLVHADEIFCDGQILPLYGHENSILEEPKPAPSILLHKVNQSWRKRSKRLLQKCFWFVRPLCRKVVFLRRSVKVDDIDRKLRAVKSLNTTPIMSPQRNNMRYCFSNNDLRKVKSCNGSPLASPSASCSSYDWSIDNSIYEAIVYCKRTINET